MSRRYGDSFRRYGKRRRTANWFAEQTSFQERLKCFGKTSGTKERVGLQATVCGIWNVERLYQELMAPECTQFYATSLFESKTTELRVLSNNIFNDPVSESVVSVSDRCDDEGLPQFAFEIRLCRNISRPHTGAQIRDDYRCLIEEAAVTYHSLHKILAL